MISREAFDAYCKATDSLVGGVSEGVERQIRELIAQNPGMSTSQLRKRAIEIMSGAVQSADDAAAALAAEWYDQQAEAAHAKLPAAITETSWSRGRLEDKVHWSVGMAGDGRTDAFVRSCGDYVRNDMKRSLNRTIMANARRDKSKGVRYARVPSGHETCAFCFMLATRGAVHFTRETAGELGQYHSHCDCKVVPGFGGDHKFDELVEGWRFREAYGRLKLIEGQLGVKVDGKDWKASQVVTKEMARRDRRWIYSGTTPEVDFSMIDVGRLNEVQLRAFVKDKRAAEALSAAGYKVVMTDSPLVKHGVSIPVFDYSIAGEDWEAKCPEGTGYLAVAGNFAKSDAKFRKVGQRSRTVLSNLSGELDDDRFVSFYEESKHDPESDYSNADTVILLLKDGRVIVDRMH